MDSQGLGSKPFPMTLRARNRRHISHKPFAVAVGPNFFQGLMQPLQDPVETGARTFSALRAKEQNLLLFGGEMLERLAQVDFVAFSGKMNQLG